MWGPGRWQSAWPRDELLGGAGVFFDKNGAGLVTVLDKDGQPLGNARLTVLASAARAGTTQSDWFSNGNFRGVVAVLRVTAASGTGGLVLRFVGQDLISGATYHLNGPPTAVVATGTYVYELYPGVGAASGEVMQRTSGALPAVWAIKVQHNDASSYTYSVSVDLLV